MGCAFDPAIIHHASFAANPDSRDGRYSTPHGVYAPHCGLSAVRMSWGHDEYMAQVRVLACVAHVCHGSLTLSPLF